MFGKVHNDHSLTPECGTPRDLKTRVQTVNCRSVAVHDLWVEGLVCWDVLEGVKLV